MQSVFQGDLKWYLLAAAIVAWGGLIPVHFQRKRVQLRVSGAWLIDAHMGIARQLVHDLRRSELLGWAYVSVLVASAFLVPLNPWVLASGTLLGLVVLSKAYQRADAVMTGLRCRPNPSNPYELFVSYAGKQVHLVRPVIEALLAQGVSLWFDEYSLDIEESEEPSLTAAIDAGLRSSKRLLALTDENYWNSRMCVRERESFASRADAVDEVACPTTAAVFMERAAVALGISPVPLRSQSSPPDEMVLLQTSTAEFWLPAAGWKRSGQPKHDARHSQSSLTMVASIAEAQVDVSIIVGKMDLPGPRWMQHDPSEEDFLTQSRRYARHYVANVAHPRGIDIRVRGVHRIYTASGRQLALTYNYVDKPKRWVRRYSIIERVHGEQHEFAILFGIDGTFEDLCRIGAALDEVVRALRVESESGKSTGA